jgi:hypothetical protein
MAQLIRVGAVLLAGVAWLLTAAWLWRTSVPDALALPPVNAEAVFGERTIQ